MTTEMQINPKARNFVPLPKDTPYTKSQLEAIFGGDLGALAQIIELGRKAYSERAAGASEDPTTPAPP